LSRPESKDILFARIYTIGQGYDHSDTNQLIINLKHSPTSRPALLRHKQKAIAKFAEELAQLFRHNRATPLALMPMPPSKARSDADFDNRLDQVADRVTKQCANVVVFPLLERARSVSSHHAGAPRSARACFDSIRIVKSVRDRLENSTKRVIAVLDDVLTSGAHYEAARQHLQREFPNDRIIGVFWAKAESSPCP